MQITGLGRRGILEGIGMKLMRILGIALIAAGIASIFLGVILSRVNFFIAALVLGIIGNVLYWLGKPKYIEEEEEPEDESTTPHPDDDHPSSPPPAG